MEEGESGVRRGLHRWKLNNKIRKLDIERSGK